MSDVHGPFALVRDPHWPRPSHPDPDPVEPPRLQLRGAWSPHAALHPMPAVTSAQQHGLVYPLRRVVSAGTLDAHGGALYTLSCGHSVRRILVGRSLSAAYSRECGREVP